MVGTHRMRPRGENNVGTSRAASLHCFYKINMKNPDTNALRASAPKKNESEHGAHLFQLFGKEMPFVHFLLKQVFFLFVEGKVGIVGCKVGVL